MGIAGSNQITRGLVVTKAREWVGTPRREHQQIKGVGCDCVGFLIGLGNEVGYLEETIENYPRMARDDHLLKILDRYLLRLPDKNYNPGDIIVLQIRGLLTHVGLVTDNHTVIHSHNRLGVIESPLSFYSSKISVVYTLNQYGT